MTGKDTIVYIDDEELNVQLFELLMAKKFNVLTGLSGAEGLNIVNENPLVKIVLSDLKMPGMNGLDFIKEAKTKFPDLLYFIFTGYDITSEINQLIEEGVLTGYFRKPFNIKEIELVLSKALE
tara:strand:+ start:8044 stop:8412 length:369 start_codon:yes stop_codon:yes gene_type:complete